ncbi:MAG TPA: hypothetical protein VGG57_23040 [Stellaceae bacterium]
MALQGTITRLIKAHNEGDLETQRSILRGFVKHEQASYERKVQLLGESKTMKQEMRTVKGPRKRLAHLVALYKFAADVRAIGKDEIDDRETYLTANRMLQQIYPEFTAFGPEGAAAFESPLDDTSPNARACAGFNLIATLPEKAIPVLEEIKRSPGLTCAWLDADFALAKYRIGRRTV